MHWLLLILISFPRLAHARLLFEYGLNYSQEKDTTEDDDYAKTRTFHKAFLGAAINSKQNIFFGWNINSWSSKLTSAPDSESSYSMLEMGPRFLIFMGESYHWYLSAEWNPYAKGDRDKGGSSREIQGSSMGAGLGYRFKLSGAVGLGAGIHYHSLALKEEKVDTTESNITDKITNIMPMIELSILTK